MSNEHNRYDSEGQCPKCGSWDVDWQDQDTTTSGSQHFQSGTCDD